MATLESSQSEYQPPALPPPFMHTSPPPTLFIQGAEAHIYKTTFLNPSIPAALKVRPSKPYRHPILDRKLTRQRILQEARCLVKLVREGVPVPAVLSVDWEGQWQSKNATAGAGGCWLLMEWIDGPVVRVVIAKWERWLKSVEREVSRAQGVDDDKAAEEGIRDLMRRIGRAIGRLHKAGVVHGDLTTSNLVLQQPPESSTESDTPGTPSTEGDVVLIDFGLASQSSQDEDRAVDLYVLERAFGSTHPQAEGFFQDDLLKGYSESYKGANGVLKKLEGVRMRGRKRSMLG